MFKTKKSRIELDVAEKTFTSSEIATIAGVSLRQLQWWDEQKVVSPNHEGHKRIYLQEEAVEITVIAELRRKGFLHCDDHTRLKSKHSRDAGDTRHRFYAVRASILEDD